MALTKCPSCSKPLSDKAVKCPHCGIDIKHITPYLPSSNNRRGNKPSASKFLVPLIVLLLITFGYFAWDKGVFFNMWNNTETIEDSTVNAYKQEQKEIAEQHKRQKEAEEQRKQEGILEQFKNFHTKDLSAFMLHGRVQQMTEKHTYGKVVYYFDKNGKLTKVNSFGNICSSPIWEDRESGCQILRMYYKDKSEAYIHIIDRYGHLIEARYENYVGFETTIEHYSNFDSNGWPHTVHREGAFVGEGAEYPEFDAHQNFNYSNLDKYGNWCSDGYFVRHIEYYPTEQL